MIYPLVGVSLLVMIMLFKARGVLAVVLSERNMRVGDYDGALRKLRWMGLGRPNALILHKRGLVLSLAGRPKEAVDCYRKALAVSQSGPAYPRERLHACLGYALMDLGRYDEAEQCFHHAIEQGDHTGNSQDGLAEIRLAQGIEPEKALAYAGQAIHHAKRRQDGRIPGSYFAHQAWALALLGRSEEARESLVLALSVPEPNRRGSASLHWRAGMVLLAMQQTEEANSHFQIAHQVDPRGKYGNRCLELLRQHSAA
jgi:tetratricopeptide (TPR) repeat protein